jgi:hypothetical protein
VIRGADAHGGTQQHQEPANVTTKWAAWPNSHWARQRRQSEGTASTAQRPISGVGEVHHRKPPSQGKHKQTAATAASRPPRSPRPAPRTPRRQ